MGVNQFLVNIGVIPWYIWHMERRQVVEIGVILVVDAETFEVIFEHNLSLTRQNIHCDISNRRWYHINVVLTNQPLRCNYFEDIEVSE